jgi:adenosylcobinamide-GDP ribazoletransferase
MRRAAYFYSLVGLGIGGLLVVFNAATQRWLPLAGRIVFLLVLSALVTGGLHLDGLADTTDGVFGGRTRERRLEIMRDSRIGTFGVLGLLAILSLQFIALLELPQSLLAPALLLAPGWGRASMVLLIVGALSLAFSPFMTIWSAVGSIATTCLMSLYFRSRLGGQTGDTLGSTSQLVETTVLWVYLLVVKK